MTSLLSLIINACGAWSTITALYFAVRGANVADCITVALCGLAMAIIGTACLFASQPDWRTY